MPRACFHIFENRPKCVNHRPLPRIGEAARFDAPASAREARRAGPHAAFPPLPAHPYRTEHRQHRPRPPALDQRHRQRPADHGVGQTPWCFIPPEPSGHAGGRGYEHGLQRACRRPETREAPPRSGDIPVAVPPAAEQPISPGEAVGERPPHAREIGRCARWTAATGMSPLPVSTARPPGMTRFPSIVTKHPS